MPIKVNLHIKSPSLSKWCRQWGKAPQSRGMALAASSPLGCFVSGGLNLSQVHPPSVHFPPPFCVGFWSRHTGDTDGYSHLLHTSPSPIWKPTSGKPGPGFVIFLAIQPRLIRECCRDMPVFLPWIELRSVFWSDTNREHLNQGLVLPAKLQSGSLKPHTQRLLFPEAEFGWAVSVCWYHQFGFLLKSKNKTLVKDTVKIWAVGNAAWGCHHGIRKNEGQSRVRHCLIQRDRQLSPHQSCCWGGWDRKPHLVLVFAHPPCARCWLPRCWCPWARTGCCTWLGFLCFAVQVESCS